MLNIFAEIDKIFAEAAKNLTAYQPPPKPEPKPKGGTDEMPKM